MTEVAENHAIRLAIPLRRYGDSLVEDIEAYEADEDIELTPALEAVLKRDFIYRQRDVQIQGRSFRASVYEASDDEGPVYVVTDVDRVPAALEEAQESDPPQGEALDDVFSFLFEHRIAHDYLDSLHERLATCESLQATGAVSLKSRFVPPTLAVVAPTADVPASGELASEVSWTFDDLQRVSRAVILGSPGAGKTSLLRRLALEHCARTPASGYFPVYIQLRELAGSSAGGEVASLSSRVTRVFESTAKVTLEDVIGTGRVMLLLDGLDEIPPSNRNRLVSELRVMCRDYPRLAVIVSCRSQSYSGGLEGFQHLAIKPFDDSQIAQWVYNNLSEYDTRIFLKNMLAEPTVHSAARWPLLLTIAVDLFKSYGTVSRSRSFLYQSCVEALADEWDRIRGVKRFDFTSPAPEKVVRALCQIARRTIESDQEYFTVEDFARWNVEKLDVSDGEFLESIRESTGLIAHRDSSQWYFLHKSFRDYLAAEFLVRSTGDTTELLSARILDHAWRDVWQFASERTVDASELFRRALSELASDQLEILVMLVATLLRDASVAKDVENSVADEAADFVLAEIAGRDEGGAGLQLEVSGARMILEAKVHSSNREQVSRLAGLNVLLRYIYLNRADRFVGLIFRKLRERRESWAAVVVHALERGVDYDGQIDSEGELESLQAEVVLSGDPAQTIGRDSQ